MLRLFCRSFFLAAFAAARVQIASEAEGLGQIELLPGQRPEHGGHGRAEYGAFGALGLPLNVADVSRGAQGHAIE